jgi:hypothetical protein
VGLLIPKKEEAKTMYKHIVVTAVSEDLGTREDQNTNTYGINMYSINKQSEN